ncbi:GntR family transcriptional regulator [Nitriliruptoraceae bacterium ZYF776]|nr:GntR family transcriptional regulator [Profundirhabdus halotolerans]
MFDDRSPIYLQIAEQVRDDVVHGRLRADDPVMSTNAYARTFRINPATAAKGLQVLLDEGLLYQRRGIGTFVAPDARARLLHERRARFFREVVDPVVAEARAIGVPLAEVVAHLEAARDAHPPATGDAEVTP